MKTTNSWFFTAMFWLFLLLISLWGFGLAGTWAFVVGVCCLVFPAGGVVVYSLMVGFGALIADDKDQE